MRPIPKKLRERLAADPFMKRCIHAGRASGASCSGRIEWEHAMTHAGRQVNEWWAIVPVCTYHHRGGGLDKSLNRHAALQRASEADLDRYLKTDWKRLKQTLYRRYGLEQERQ